MFLFLLNNIISFKSKFIQHYLISITIIECFKLVSHSHFRDRILRIWERLYTIGNEPLLSYDIEKKIVVQDKA